MKLKHILLTFMLVLFSGLFLTACGQEPVNPSQPGDSNIEINGVSFVDKTVVYNGNEFVLEVTGSLPKGVQAKYTNNKAINAGTYNSTVVLSGKGYKTKTMSAKLIIEKATYDMSNVEWVSDDFTYDATEKQVYVEGLPNGVTVKNYINNKKTAANTYEASVEFNYDSQNYNEPTIQNCSWEIKKATFTDVFFKSQSFDYDSTEKTIEVTGFLPEGTTIEYTCAENENIENSAIETGTYSITATIENPNFNTLILEAVLTIKGVEDERHIVSTPNGTLYFANSLDNDYLYSYDGTTISKVSSDVPYYFVTNQNSVYFISKSLFGNAIKTIETSTSSIYSAKAEYLISDGNYFYYVVNNLTQKNSGIYKLDNSGTNPVVTKIFNGKAKHLTYNDGNIYFADGTNGYKLTKLNLSTKETSLLRDEKISALIYNNGYLFYTVDNLLGSYIENYNLSTNVYKKLTIDAGANLTVINNQLYYINVDLFTSYVFGDGINYVNAYPLIDNNMPGISLFKHDKKYSSLTKIGNNKIAFYDVDNQMLCTYDVSTTTVNNVLEDFEKPEETVFSTGSKTQVYDNKIYYLDVHKNKTLNCYDPATGKIRKLTSNKVSDFAIFGDYLYYNSVNYLVNNDLFKVNLKTGEIEIVSTNDCVDIIFGENTIFYVEQNASGVRTAIHQINENGEDVVMYTKGAKNLRYYNNYIYFVDGDILYRMSTSDWVEDAVETIKNKDVDVFEIDNGVIYYREVLLLNKNLCKINVDGTGYEIILTKHDPVDIVIENNIIYFYSDTVSVSTAGIFKINKDGTGLTKIMDKTVEDTTYYPSELSILNNNIYFINYALSGAAGDSYLYKISLTDGDVLKIS